MKIKIGSKVSIAGRKMYIEAINLGDDLVTATDEDGMEYTVSNSAIDYVYEDDTTAVYDD